MGQQLSNCILPDGEYLISNHDHLLKTVIVQGDSSTAGAPLVQVNKATALLNNPTRNWQLGSAGGLCVITNSASNLVISRDTSTNAAVVQPLPGCGVKAFGLLQSTTYAGFYRLYAINGTSINGALDLNGDSVIINSPNNGASQTWFLTLVGPPPLG